MTDKSNLFFFFGSLRKGYWNNGMLSEDAVYLGPARTVKGFNLFIGKSGHVPTCQPDAAASPMIGEVWALSGRDESNVYSLETGYEHGVFQVTLLEKPEEILEATIFHHTKPETCWYLSGGPVLVPSGDYTDVVTREGRRVNG